jgi:hypothetical protein
MNTTANTSFKKVVLAASGLVLLSALAARPAASQEVGGLELLERIGSHTGELRTHFAAVPTAAELDARAKLGALLARGSGIQFEGKPLPLGETRTALTSPLDPSASFEVDRVTGNFLFNGGLLKYRKDESTPNLPQDAELAKLAIAQLRRHGLAIDPAQMKIAHVGGLNMAATDGGEKSQIFQKLKTVRFGRTLDGLPVEGDGRIVMHLGEAGAVAGLVFQWPRLEKALVLGDDMLQKPELLRMRALDEIKSMAAKSQRARLTRAELVLYDDGRGVLEPAYHFILERYMDQGERELVMIPYDFYLPATTKPLAFYPHMEVAPIAPVDGTGEGDDQSDKNDD